MSDIEGTESGGVVGALAEAAADAEARADAAEETIRQMADPNEARDREARMDRIEARISEWENNQQASAEASLAMAEALTAIQTRLEELTQQQSRLSAAEEAEAVAEAQTPDQPENVAPVVVLANPGTTAPVAPEAPPPEAPPEPRKRKSRWM